MIHGEHRIRYERSLRVGEEVYCYTVFKDYREKEGRGGSLGLLTLERHGESPSGE
jgi:hydroxyacyl-ACP dehydratase HTD2-like protein with hotdog domain